MITAAVRAANREREWIGKAHRECPICASLHLEYEFLIEKSPVCRCQTCGLLFLNPAAAGTVQDAPPPVSPSYAALREANSEEKIRHLVQYSGLQSGHILLIGGDESLTTAAHKWGFDVQALSAQEFESAVDSEWSEPVDLCILYCALERMADPLLALQFLRRVLADHGALLVIAPTTDSRAAKLFRSSWWEFNRSNRFYFSADTLQNLLLKAGFGDPVIAPDRTLVSMNYLRESLAKVPRRTAHHKVMRGVTAASPSIAQ